MSLNSEEIARTRAELHANLALTGLTPEQIAADLGYTLARLRSTVDADAASDPVDAWELRDYLERAVRDAGRTPVPFTVLTERSRVAARMWFRLRKAPRHDFTAA